MSDIQRYYGVDVNYYKSWKGKEFALKEIDGSWEEGL